jgi:hypothetical protein
MEQLLFRAGGGVEGELGALPLLEPDNVNKLHIFCNSNNRVIRKVRKTQHQNPKFGHTQGEIQKQTTKKYISIQRGMKLRKPSCLSFFLSSSTTATYVFTASNCTTLL